MDLYIIIKKYLRKKLYKNIVIISFNKCVNYSPPVAQLVERPIVVVIKIRMAAGSNPVWRIFSLR